MVEHGSKVMQQDNDVVSADAILQYLIKRKRPVDDIFYSSHPSLIYIYFCNLLLNMVEIFLATPHTTIGR
jgi:hypothetical protein